MSRAGLAAALVACLALALAARSVAAVHTSPAGVALIARFEGFRPVPYLDPVGVATVGYGHTAGVRSGARWVAGQRTPGVLSPAEAARLLRADLARSFEPPVRALFAAGGPLAGAFNQHRFDALVSASYNLGAGLTRCAFPSMCAALAQRSLPAIAAALLRYDHAGGVRLPGLQRRRTAEAALFLRPMARFELFRPCEIRWIRGFDRLRGHASRRAAQVRLTLRAQMAAWARRIARAARRAHDWQSGRRRVRYRALARRARSSIRPAQASRRAGSWAFVGCRCSPPSE